MITLTFECGGCFKKEPGMLRSGIRVHGFAEDVKFPYMVAKSSLHMQDYAPEGWIAFDPYTKATYCTECWAQIESGELDD